MTANLWKFRPFFRKHLLYLYNFVHDFKISLTYYLNKIDQLNIRNIYKMLVHGLNWKFPVEERRNGKKLVGYY